MKKYFVLIPLLLLSCKKEAEKTETTGRDSSLTTERTQPIADSQALKKKDSIINNAPVTKQVLKTGVMREVKNGEITRTMDASQLPFTLGEQFTDQNQKLILKISNFDQSKIKANINTRQKDFNIRFNQIRLPNGDYDGPFGNEITYDVKGKGEVWLIIGKDQMAEGNTKGDFTVSVE
ncbi:MULTISPECIES: hypothetical protein [Chryseobacterium]|uniref:Lipoprotein n=1 Tax=Chryseobacterium camelliae TaxID=1265445 RepID=A0ABU0TP10_9FLAO|nr:MULTISPECIES: hypothetical protein [Chryseobacterium]MDT3407384.1 hypothetical protein [Pseudacidovorax intermedius]MDQ1098767.1 hypothetical protein [Chryseobacterium camelliae]MDQ1102691.1 hypothetical protein [Chryseobacterium sp. SORGH_AS_1048]MDR6086120.1 hypothetical protein [Chryseobacterium sp. SORGH_AS_0909]MDR6130490.1 hypothetical protein [Chryseobacterium sp. SORGH_AS_1175]